VLSVLKKLREIFFLSWHFGRDLAQLGGEGGKSWHADLLGGPYREVMGFWVV